MVTALVSIYFINEVATKIVDLKWTDVAFAIFLVVVLSSGLKKINDTIS